MINDDKAIAALNNTDKRAAGLNKVLGGLGKAAMVVGTALVVGFGAALASGIKGSIEAENAVSQLEAVLKSTGGAAGMTKDKLIALADGLQATTKFSTEMVLEAESLLLTFTNIGQETFPRATQAAADMATALGTDMAGQSIALGKALNDPMKGITALTRVGVTFTEEQKKSIKVMQESGDMAGAQTIILKELEKEFGGSAAAAGDTFAGKLEILKNKWGDVTEALAGKFMPYLEKFMDWVSANMPAIQAIMQKVFDGIGTAISFVIDAFDTVRTAVMFFIDGIKGVGDPDALIGSWESVAYRVGEAVRVAFEKAKEIVLDLYDAFNEYVMPILKDLWDWLEPNLPAIKQFFVDAFGTAKDLLNDVVTAVKDVTKWMVDHWNIVGPILAGIAGAVLVYGAIAAAMDLWAIATGAWAVITSIAAVVGAAFGLVVAFITSPIGIVIIAIGLLIAIGVLLYKNWDVIIAWLKKAWEDIKTFAVNTFTSVKNFFVQLWTDITTAIKKAWNAVGTFFTNIWLGIKTGISTAWQAIANFFTITIPQIIANIITFFSELPNKIAYAIGFVIGKLIQWGINLVNWAIVNIPLFITSVVTFFQELPGKIWAWLVQAVTDIGTWLVNMGTKAKEGLTTLITAIISFYASLPGKIWTWLVKAVSDVGTWLSNMRTQASTGLSTFISNIITFFSSLPDKIWTWLVSVVTKVATWITDMQAKIAEKFPEIITKITSFFTELPGKILQVGKDIITNLWNGISGAWTWLKDKVSGLFGGLVAGIKAGLGISSNVTVATQNNGPPRFAVGSRYLPSDMLIQAHQGEMIVPKSENPYANSGGSTMPQGAALNLDYDKLAEAMMKFEFVVDDRKFGRMVKKAYA